MTERDEIEALAGEYVLGTLSLQERAAVDARRMREPALAAAIVAWQQRLSPLDESAAPVEPSAEVFPRIEARIADATRTTAQIVSLGDRVRFWRRAAAVASALAASLLAVIVAREIEPKPQPNTLVAVLQKDAQSPAFLVSVDVDNKTMTVRPVAATHQDGKSYELWLVHDSLGAPRSLGLIDDPSIIRPAKLAGYDRNVIESATLAVSLEPAGGSTTGLPTGPVLFTGKMIDNSF